ncbi:MAG: hypothetical protein ABI863_21135 [Ginsengibacter sp.]
MPREGSLIMRIKRYFIALEICFFSLSGCVPGTGNDTYVNKNIKPLVIKGIVLNKYKEETGCFGAIIIKQNNSMDTLRNIFYCAVKEEDIWSYILPNDSLYKEKGRLVAEVVRNGNRAEFTFPSRD